MIIKTQKKTEILMMTPTPQLQKIAIKKSMTSSRRVRRSGGGGCV